MTKSDTITGRVLQVGRDLKHSKNGRPFTGIKLDDGGWYQCWGDYTGVLEGDELELTVTWSAPDDGPVFCTVDSRDGRGQPPPADHPQHTMRKGGEKFLASRAEPRSLEERIAALEEIVRKHEVQLQAMTSADVPEDIPF